ncbi:MAG: GspE/PulE/PilB domain-containing protein, partial [Planctomycetota bacterium]
MADTDPPTMALNGQTTDIDAPNAEGLRDRCRLLGVEWLEDQPDATQDAIDLITADVAVRLAVIPLSIEGHALHVAMLDPLDIAAVDELATLVGRPVVRFGIAADLFANLMRDHYGTTAQRMAESLASEAS